MNDFRRLSVFSVGLIFCLACKTPADEKETGPETSGTPVTAAHVAFRDISDSVELNATSAFLLNYYVKAASTGYVRHVGVVPGQYVQEGNTLFSIQTKESMVIGKSISSLDTNFRFDGISNIQAAGHGYITQINHQVGDYVQDGEMLAVISSLNSFAFLMNVPYAWRSFIQLNREARLYLSDGSQLTGKMSSLMPTLDSVSQSQVVVIKVDISKPLPQDLIASVRIPKTVRKNAQVIPKSAVLANDSQTQCWVMKMIDSVTAVRLDVKKGMEWRDSIEILDPIFSKDDLILISGNFGLPDTAKVILQKP